MRAALVVALVLLFLASSVGAAIADQSSPDFAHPSTPHSLLFSPVGGQEDRPILVIYLRWDDVDYPVGFDAPMVASRFFGTGLPSITFPSVGDYFRRLSFNDLFLFPAAEWEGTEQDGIVQVTVPGTRADFFTLSEHARNKRALELANPYVDFASFDSDNNGSLSNLELIVNVLESTTIPLPQGCGIRRGVQAVSLDGKNLSGLTVAMNNTATNLITIIHENAHAAADMEDLYGFDVGNFDIGAGTCGLADTTLFAPNAWHKMHWGWISPTVVTQDGYYDIRRADTTGDAFILHDPDHGTNDYFMVENRRPTPGTYDRSVADDGLIIWRVADAALGIIGLTPIGLVRPTPSASAWDASDPAAPQRTMAGQAWFDGTSSNVAVRAISRRGDVMRAYFDVRGPGVLIDTYPLDLTAPVRVTAAGANQIDVPLMNTGEACDTFVVEAVQLPPAWTASPGARILCAGESSFARITVTPDANAVVGAHAIVVRGRSTTDATVMTDSPLSVEVVLRPTRFGLTDLLSLTTTGTATTFSARLSPIDDPLEPGLAGVPVTFTLAGPGGTITLATITNGSGVATVTSFLALPPSTYALTIESERVGALGPSLVTIPYEVLSIAGTIEHVAHELTARIAAATNSGVGSALLAAREELVGNHGDAANNGALDKLTVGSPASALTKIRAAMSQLLVAETRGAGDLSQLTTLLRLAAEAIAAQR